MLRAILVDSVLDKGTQAQCSLKLPLRHSNTQSLDATRPPGEGFSYHVHIYRTYNLSSPLTPNIGGKIHQSPLPPLVPPTGGETWGGGESGAINYGYGQNQLGRRSSFFRIL